MSLELRTYLTSQTGNRYYLTLAKAKNLEMRLARCNEAYEALRAGEKPSVELVKFVRELGRELLRLTKKPNFFSSEGQHKMEASNKASKGLLMSFVMHLAPANSSGFQVCPWASLGCIKSCLNLAGHGPIVNVQAGRVKRTKLYFECRSVFCLLLWDQLDRMSRRKYKYAIRLNGTSDLAWETREPWIFSMFPGHIFYDYTKSAARARRPKPHNYHLTFSRSETNHKQALDLLSRGVNVAIVFDYETWQQVTTDGTWNGYHVTDGSADDRRFLDKPGVVALKPLGPAVQDDSGFVLRDSLRIIDQGVAA